MCTSDTNMQYIDTIKLAKMEMHATSQINQINDQNCHLSHVCTQFLVLGSVLEPDPARSFENTQKFSKIFVASCTTLMTK